jgi:hypothetical protein
MVITSFTIVIILHGLTYIHSYNLNSVLVNKEFISEHRNMKDLKITNSVVLPLVSTEYITILPSILAGVYFTHAWDKISIIKAPQYSKYLEHKIYLLIEKNLYLNNKFQPKSIVYEGRYLMVIDSGLLVKDSLDGVFFDLSKINSKDIIANLDINNIPHNSIAKD